MARFNRIDQPGELYATVWGWESAAFLSIVFWDGSWDQLRRDVP